MPRALLLVLMLAAPLLQAATLIESRGPDGVLSKLWVEGTKARAESPAEQGYLIMDLDHGSMYMVSDQERQILDMSSQLQRREGEPPQANYKLEKKGPGPKVAGYGTEHYQLLAGGQVCADLYLSREAFEDAGVEAYAKAFSSYDFNPGMSRDPCDQADSRVEAHMLELGLPLRTVEEGEVVDEVESIQSKAQLPPGGFSLPEGYARVDMGQMMQQMHQQMRQMYEGMSEQERRQMEQMLQQMAPPESGDPQQR